MALKHHAGAASPAGQSGPSGRTGPVAQSTWTELWTRHHLALAVAANTLFLVAGSVATARGAPPALSTTLFVIAYIAGGVFSLREGLQSLFKDRRIDVDLLMVMAAVAAAFIGEWLEGGILLFL